MDDVTLSALHADRFQRVQRDAELAGRLDEIESILEYTSTGRKLGYQRAKQLLGTSEDARRWANVSEEALGALQDRGLTPQDVRAMYAARDRLTASQSALDRLTAEVDKRGLDVERIGIQNEGRTPPQSPRSGSPLSNDLPFAIGSVLLGASAFRSRGRPTQ